MDIIKREQLRNNFLKTIVIRLDFQNVLEKDMIEIIPIVKEYAESIGFVRFEEKKLGELNVNVSENDFGTPNVTSSIVNEKKIYCFIDETGYMLGFSDAFVFVRLVSTKYVPFEEYFEIISKVINIISKHCSFFTEKRFGIRKINKCLLRDKSLIKKYFNSEVINFYNNENITNNMICRKLDVFEKDNCLTNFNRSILQGKVNEDVLYQVELDIDSYIKEVDLIKDIIYEKEKVLKLNDTIFEVFISSLTKEFIKELMKEDFEVLDVIGVEPNE